MVTSEQIALRKQKASERAKKWYRENKERRKEYNKNHIDSIRIHGRKHHLKMKYNITLDDEQKLLDSVERKCEICGSTKLLGIDHDHITGKIRGILCRQCNAAAGQARDNPKILYALAQYLEERSGQ